MKTPKSEPYRRSRHRAALHAWAVAATTVASIGMSAQAATPQRDHLSMLSHSDDLSPVLDPMRVATDFIDAVYIGDTQAALSMMRLPSVSDHLKLVHEDLAVLTDLLRQEGVEVKPVEHRRAGHWALSAWQMNVPDVSLGPVMEPVVLYHPSSDDLFERSAHWQVMPQGVEADPALKPLYNADYAALQDWYQTLI